MSSASPFQLKKRGQAKNSNKNKRARKCLFHSKDLKQHGEDGEVCPIDLTRSPDLVKMNPSPDGTEYRLRISTGETETPVLMMRTV